MEKDSKETIVEIITAFLVVISAYTGNQYLIFGTIVSTSISLWFWYDSNITRPIKQLQDETKELHKDLNTRKEIENIKMKMQEILLRIKDKKAGINPFLFIIILAIIAMIILYLKDKGFI